jgi:hypothetical protein
MTPDSLQTTLFYLFSSLIQADAALLGFGAFFVVYKIQSLEGRIPQAMQLAELRKNSEDQTIAYMMGSGRLSNKATYIARYPIGDFIRKQMEMIEAIPKRVQEVKRLLKAPVVVIAVHTVFCAVGLWLSAFISTFAVLGHVLMFMTILWFAVGIAMASRLALNLTVKDDELSLERLDPELFSEIRKEEEKNKRK